MASTRQRAKKKTKGPPSYCHETYRQERVRCGRDGCKCASGRLEDQHGPYWYGYWTDVDGKTRKRYLGKKFDPDAEARRFWQARERAWRREEAKAKRRARSWSWLDELLEQQRRAPPPPPPDRPEVPSDADYQLLGITPWVTAPELARVRRRLALQHHPDRGGDTRTMQAINAACDRIGRWLEVRRIPGL